MNFERIYNECNLPAENKPLKSFKEIFLECNVKPLNEQTLREMSASSIEHFIDNVANAIKHEILKKENIEYWQSHNNNTLKTKSFQDKLTELLKSIVSDFIANNDKPHDTNPFVMIDGNGNILIYTDANEKRIQNYEQILKNKYFNNSKPVIVRNGNKSIEIVGIKRIQETNDDEIKQWVQNGINSITANISLNKGHLMLAKDYESVIKNTFISKYKQLQGLE